MAWEDPKIHGTQNISQEDAYRMMSGINKQLRDKKISDEKSAQEMAGQSPVVEPKKGFGSY